MSQLVVLEECEGVQRGMVVLTCAGEVVMDALYGWVVDIV